ncbi:MAG: M1 family metallopeptidase [Candidatus Spechtbacterales bacterium]|nr:M1 family metallopeptidase [Candidatus Spechtbacterales bacterium]
MSKKSANALRIDGNPYRLPVNLTPIHQDIHLEMPKLENAGEDEYFGITSLQFRLDRPADKVILNSKGIKYDSAVVYSAAGLEQRATDIEVDNDSETVTFCFDSPLSGENLLEIEFHRKFNPPNKMRGLHESVFELPDDTERVMATTQFESTHAREAFPCCDDPLQKATFQTTLVVPEDRTAVSTTEIISEHSLGNGLKEVQFAKTPRMPTYLLAFIVGDWEYLEDETSDGIRVRVYATPGKIDKLQFALDTTVRALEWFGNYHDFSYKNIANKCDVLAIPDFEAGAMENIGAITFREVLLFVDESTSTILKRRVAEIICHELEHQWKGNLVTPAWWNNLWLKESFATFMAYKCVDALFPQWKVWDEFVSGMASGGKSLASLQSAHPIEAPVENPDEIDQIYDAISYNMGGSVLRMLEDWLGEDIFREGIRLYIERHQFANTQTEDLWAALAEVSGEPVVEVMNSWTKQTGYPVVSVNRKNGKVALHQERFLINGSSNGRDGTLWSAPITYRDSDGNENTIVINERESVLPVSAEKTIQLNVGQAGVLRVNYADKDLAALVRQMNKLDVVDRLVLAEDMYNLMRAGYRKVDEYLEFVSAYKSEQNYNVWNTVALGLGALHSIFFEHDNIEDLKAYAVELLEEAVDSVGFSPADNESDDIGLLRQTVLSLSAKFDNEEVIEEARNLFAASDVSLGNIDPDLRGIVLGAVSKNGDSKMFEEFIERYEKSLELQAKLGPELSLKYMSCISNFRDRDLFIRALDYSLSNKVRPQDAVRMWGTPQELTRIAWEYLKDNWDVLDEKFGSTRMIGGFITGVIGGIPDRVFADEVEEFFNENPAPRATEKIKQTLEGMRIRAKFKEENEDAFSEFFNG